eukprot:1672693-Pleurochrysis_carterae.AAC.1
MRLQTRGCVQARSCDCARAWHTRLRRARATAERLLTPQSRNASALVSQKEWQNVAPARSRSAIIPAC